MDKEQDKNPLRRLLPKTTGEKMITGGITVDLGVISSSVLVSHLNKEGVINLSSEQIQSLKDVLFFGGHIILSDAILKIGGVVRMTFFEEENCLKKKRS